MNRAGPSRGVLCALASAALGAFVLGSPVLGVSVLAQTSDLDPRVVSLIDQVSEARLASTLQTLEGFDTRHTLSSTTASTRGIGAARQWLFDQLTGYSPRLRVSFDTHSIAAHGAITRPVEIRNVMAVLPGRSARRIYVSAHYDSIARMNGSSATDDAPAPGVNDDGSGVALTLELARIFSQSGVDFDATLVFMLHAGEEQGSVGASLHAQKAVAGHVPIDAVFNNDIVGGTTAGNGIVDDATVRLYAEGPEDSPSRALARFVVRWAARYVPSHTVRPMARADRFGRFGDQSAYTQRGFAAVVFRESRENFSRQHDARDTLEGVSTTYLARNARVNAAAAATLALAPAAPVVVDAHGLPMLDRSPTGYDAHLRWMPSSGATGYRVFWREAWGPDWQHEQRLGNVTEWVLPGMVIDDLVFGVAAVDEAGHESVVAAYAPRAPGGRP